MIQFGDYDQGAFKVRQKEYFARLLGRTWDCREPGHTVCVPTEDGQHHRLSNENFAKWVNALWVGEATLLQPPDGILMPRASSGPSTLVVRAVSTPPSHRRNAKSPMLCTTSSICDTFSSRLSSSGASGPGYYSGKAMEWLGKKCIHGIESAIIFKRCWQHEYRLKQLQASGDFGKHRDELSTCLGDALELSQFCYSDRVRERAWALARRVHTLTLGRVSSSSMESWTWVTICRICTIPIYIAYRHGFELDFIYEIHDELTKVPLALQDTRTISPVIRILGFALCDVLGSTLKFRKLTADERQVIYSLATHRLERHVETSSTQCRPWEVAIIGMCSSKHPELKDLVRGPSGIQSLVLALRILLGTDVLYVTNGHLNELADVLLSMSWLSGRSRSWIVDIANRDNVALLVDVLRRRVTGHKTSYGALVVLDDIVSYQPTLIEDFVQLDGESTFHNVVSILQKELKSVRNDPLVEFWATKSLASVDRLRHAIQQRDTSD